MGAGRPGGEPAPGRETTVSAGRPATAAGAAAGPRRARPYTAGSQRSRSETNRPQPSDSTDPVAGSGPPGSLVSGDSAVAQ